MFSGPLTRPAFFMESRIARFKCRTSSFVPAKTRPVFVGFSICQETKSPITRSKRALGCAKMNGLLLPVAEQAILRSAIAKVLHGLTMRRLLLAANRVQASGANDLNHGLQGVAGHDGGQLQRVARQDQANRMAALSAMAQQPRHVDRAHQSRLIHDQNGSARKKVATF